MTMTTHPTTGITPACAGNTRHQLRHGAESGDHPRLRGEYHFRRNCSNSSRGSPPLARGIPYTVATQSDPLGITPACAGNTPSRPPPTPGMWDHPRLRGEYGRLRIFTSTFMGSPPLARGIHLFADSLRPGAGITPACAGNTIVTPFFFRFLWDHPRLRGEY